MKKLKLHKNEKDLTVKGAFEEYQRSNKLRNLAQQTLYHKEEHIKKFFKFLENDNFLIKNVNKKLADNFAYFLLESGVKAITINTYLRNLRAFIYWCSDNSYLERFKFTMLKVDEEVKETYSEMQMNILLVKPDVKKCSFVEYRNWVMINYFIATGNRLNTVINLKIGDIDFDNELITLKTVKNKKQQIIPAPSSLCQVLKEYLEFRKGNNDDFLFVNVYNKQLTRLTTEKSIAKYNIDRGVNITSIHAFRHTFAKLFIKSGGDVFRLQKLMGHSDISVTRIYVNLFADDIKENYEKFNPLEILNNKSKKDFIKLN